MEKIISDGLTFTEEEKKQFIEYRRMKMAEEARAKVARLEYDLLSPYTDKTEFRRICKTADRLGLGAIVVQPNMVKSCVSFLGRDPKCSLVALIAAPHGGDATEIKAAAVKRAVKDGVDEAEVCAPTFYLREGNAGYFKRECKKLKKACKGRALRVAFDCAALPQPELLKACVIATDAGVNMLRLNGASGEIISRVQIAVKDRCLIKADGADTLAAFENLIALGASCVCSHCAAELANALIK